MILTAEGADFSANKIGVVDVPIPLLDETTAILARYSATPTDKVKSALNTFVSGLKTQGIYSKLLKLSLPFLASNLAEATKSALDGTSCFNNGVSNSSVAEPTSEQLSLSNKSLSVVAGGTATNIWVGKYQPLVNMSVGLFIHSNTTETGNVVVLGSGTSGRVENLAISSNLIGLNMPAVSCNISAYSGGQNDANKFVGFSNYDGNTTFVYGADQKKTGTVTTSSTDTNVNTIKFGVKAIATSTTYADDSTWKYMRQSVSLIYVSEGLTESQLVSLKQLTETMMSKVFA